MADQILREALLRLGVRDHVSPAISCAADCDKETPLIEAGRPTRCTTLLAISKFGLSPKDFGTSFVFQNSLLYGLDLLHNQNITMIPPRAKLKFTRHSLSVEGPSSFPTAIVLVRQRLFKPPKSGDFPLIG